MNWSDFFNMGGYAFYVWSSWGLSLLIFVGHFIHAKYQRTHITKQLQRQLSRAEKYQQ